MYSQSSPRSGGVSRERPARPPTTASRRSDGPALSGLDFARGGGASDSSRAALRALAGSKCGLVTFDLFPEERSCPGRWSIIPAGRLSRYSSGEPAVHLDSEPVTGAAMEGRTEDLAGHSAEQRLPPFLLAGALIDWLGLRFRGGTLPKWEVSTVVASLRGMA